MAPDLLEDLRGRARRFGDNVNTDYIITSARKRDTLDERELARYLFETLDPAFAATVRAGDIIVGGRNFGCGSAMEIAATVILAAGIRAVIATSFSRTFYRNAINNALLPIESDTADIAEGDRLELTLGGLYTTLTNASRNWTRTTPPFALGARRILDAGGLVAFVRANSTHPGYRP